METNKQLVWTYSGNGMDSFGINDNPVLADIPEPKEGEVLTRVNAFSICASDAKMIRLGNDYPLFKGRNFDTNPAILGHELSLTIVKPGKGMEEEWPIGKKIGVQPDVYLNGERFCIGVTVNGGMQEYLLLGKEVFASDNGCSVFQVPDEISDAAIAQLEPLACVEASFREWPKKNSNKTLLVYINEEIDYGYSWGRNFDHEKIVLIDNGKNANRIDLPNLSKMIIETTIEDAIWKHATQGFNEILVLGTPDNKVMTQLVDSLSEGSTFCWLPDRKPSRTVKADIAKVHYANISWLGTSTKKLDDAINTPQRFSYKKNGYLLIMGGTGTMGRIHTLRALELSNGPKTVVVTGRGAERMDTLLKDFISIAKRNNKTLIGLLIDREGKWKSEAAQIAEGNGFDDIILCAPGTEPVKLAVPLLADDGKIVFFSGTSYGQYEEIPLGLVAYSGACINGSSGSTVEDQKAVLEYIRRGESNPNRHVAAIGGFRAAKQGIQAVSEGRFPGKIVIYPALLDLPLLSIHELDKISPALADEVNENGWSKKAEHIVMDFYTNERIN